MTDNTLTIEDYNALMRKCRATDEVLGLNVRDAVQTRADNLLLQERLNSLAAMFRTEQAKCAELSGLLAEERQKSASLEAEKAERGEAEQAPAGRRKRHTKE